MAKKPHKQQLQTTKEKNNAVLLDRGDRGRFSVSLKRMSIFNIDMVWNRVKIVKDKGISQKTIEIT
jgi:hypothetical protein